MDKTRLETFSDGVIAIIITIMVLELKVPHNPTWQSYFDAYPVFASYALSYVFVGLFWSSHHHLLHGATKVDNKVVWANMLALFWVSLIPFTTEGMGENSFTPVTVTVYALVLVLVSASNMLLIHHLRKLHGSTSEFTKYLKGGFRNYITITVNAIAAIVAFLGLPKIAFILIAITSIMWFLPDLRIGRNHQQKRKNE
jgi:uncharacterized membrane protein